jgi:hypothetical protein
MPSMALTSPSVAFASPQAVIRDCEHDGKLDHHYSLSDLKKAEQNLPAQVDEYTTCYDLINQAEVAGLESKGQSAHGVGAGGTGGSGGGPANPRDVRALDRATHARKGSPSLSLQGTKVVPGSGGVFKTAGASNSMPLSVLLALTAVAALAAIGGFATLRRRFPEAVAAALRVFRH